MKLFWNLDQRFKKRYRLKNFLSRSLVALCSAEQNHLCSFGPGHYENHFCEVILNLEQWFRRGCHFNIFLELWRPFSSAELNHLCSCGGGHYGEHFCEIILNLDQWFRRRCRLKTILI